MKQEWLKATSVLTVAVILASLLYIADSSIIAFRVIQGSTRVVAGPLIWYDDPGVSGVTVTLPPLKNYAYVSVNVSNKALHVYDYNESAGIVVRRTFLSNTDYSGTLQEFSFKLRVLGVNVISDASNSGVVLGEVFIGGVGYNGYYSFYYYSVNSTHGVVEARYYRNGIEGSCSSMLVNPWSPITINITMRSTGSQYNVSWFFNNVYLCSIIESASFSFVGVELGRYSWTNKYDLFVDDVSVALKTNTLNLSITEDFEDSIDEVFTRRHGGSWWYDTYYSSPSGSSPNPPGDRSVGEYIEPVYSGVVLYVNTNIADGYTVTSWKNLTSAVFTASYTENSIPVKIFNPTNISFTDYSARVTLNATNFDDWNKLSFNGSDIYFTDASGNPLYYWIESINVYAKTAVLWVKIPFLPAYSEATVYLHYGGLNPYQAYNNPNSVFLFYEDFNYKSVTELLNSGKWVGVETQYIWKIENGELYINTSSDVFAVRTTVSFMPPYIVEYTLRACANGNYDWDAGIAVGWRNTTITVRQGRDVFVLGSEYVAFTDDMYGTSTYASNPMSIAEAIDTSSWLRVDYLTGQTRGDANYLVYHVYRVFVNSTSDVFTDLTDGRSNVDDNYASRYLVTNYGSISGYLWLVNDGDTPGNCAIYDWVRVRRIPENGVELPVYPLKKAVPMAVESFTNATGESWSGILEIVNYTVVLSSSTGLLNLTANSSAQPNLSRIILFTSIPPGGGVSGVVDVLDSYGLIPSKPESIIYYLKHVVEVKGP